MEEEKQWREKTKENHDNFLNVLNFDKKIIKTNEQYRLRNEISKVEQSVSGLTSAMITENKDGKTLLIDSLDKQMKKLNSLNISLERVKNDHTNNKIDINELKERVKIKDLFEHFGIKLVNAGNKRHKCLCPFHKENNPSCTIYEETNSFNCFGCNTGGDIIEFTMLIKDISFMESIKYLNKYH